MKRYFCAITVVLFGMLPAYVYGADTSSEGLKVNANGLVLPMTSSGNSQRAPTFQNGVAVDSSALGVNKEVYVALRTDSPPCGSGATANVCGSGTKLDPYNAGGSSDSQKADRLDAILTTKQPNYDFYFTPNPSADYVTRGWLASVRRTAGNGCRLYAKGCTFRLYGAANATNDGIVFGTDGNVRTDGFEMHGGKVNADAVNQPKWTSGIARFVGMFQLKGSNNVIDGVEMVGGGSASAGIENFWCNLTNDGVSGASENNTIQNCYAHAPATGNLGTITILGTGATPVSGRTAQNNKIINNRVDLTGCDAPVTHGLAGGSDLYEGNNAAGCMSGFYSEPLYAQPNLETIRNNTFKGNIVDINVVAATGTPAAVGFLIEGNTCSGSIAHAISIYADDGLGVGAGTALRFDSVVVRNNKVNMDGALDHANIQFNLLSITSATVEGNIVRSDYAYAINVAAPNQTVSGNLSAPGIEVPYANRYNIGQMQKQVVGSVESHANTVSGTTTTGNLSVSGNMVGNGAGVYGVLANHIQSNIRHTLSDAYPTAPDDYFIFADHDAVTRTVTLTAPVAASDTQYIIIKDGANTAATHNIVISPVDGSTVSITTDSGAASMVYDPKVGWTLLWQR